MIWVPAGTIPDMDVLGKYFLSGPTTLASTEASAILSCSRSRFPSPAGYRPVGRSRHHAWIAMGTGAAAVVVGFVVNFLTMILAPGQWLPLRCTSRLWAWWWRHG